MNNSFSEAVDFAEMVLRNLIHEKKLKKTDIESTEVFFSLTLPVLNGVDERGAFNRCADESLIWLIKKAESDRGAFDLARRVIASRLIRNEPLPRLAGEFAGWIIAGVIDPPRKSKKAATFTHNVMLYWAAKRIEHDFGLFLTRGDDTGSNSACDAVSIALDKLGHGKSYRAIKDLCYHRSSAPMREMAHELHQFMLKVGSDDPEMLAYWQSQAPWNSVTE